MRTQVLILARIEFPKKLTAREWLPPFERGVRGLKLALPRFRRVYEWFQAGHSGLRQTSWSKEEPGTRLPASTRKLLPEGMKLRELDLSLLGASLSDVALLPSTNYSKFTLRYGRQSNLDAERPLPRRSAGTVRQEVCGVQGRPSARRADEPPLQQVKLDS